MEETQEPERIVRSLFERIGAKDLAGASGLFASDAVFTDAVGPTVLRGRPAIAEMIAEIWEGLPDVRVEVRAMVSRDTTVMTEIELVGTHLGTYLGCAPTGSTIRWAGIARYELDPGCTEIVAESFFYDSTGLMAQLSPVDS